MAGRPPNRFGDRPYDQHFLVPGEIRRALLRRAADSGCTVPDLLREAVTLLLATPLSPEPVTQSPLATASP